MKKGVLILILLLFLPVVSAFSINSADLYVQTQPLSYVKLQQPQSITMIVTTSNEKLTSLHADLTPLNPDPRQRGVLSNKQGNCVKNIDNQTNETTSNECAFSFIMIPQQATNVIQFTHVIDNGTANNTNTTNFTITLSIDDTRPVVSVLGTNYSSGDGYYMKSDGLTTIFADITDSIGTFEQRKIFFKVGSAAPRQAQNCSSNRCSLSSVFSCSGDTTIAIVNAGGIPSSDDAGNPVDGELRVVAKCDKDTPLVDSVEIIPDAGDRPRSGQTMGITAVVTEDMTGVTGILNATNVTDELELKRTTCTEVGPQKYNCTWSLSNIAPGQVHVDMWFIDGVGRKSPLQRQDFQIDYYMGEGNETPKFFADIQGERGSPGGYNRVAVSLANQNGLQFPMYATYKMRKIAGGHVEVLFQAIDETQCMLVSDELPEGTTNNAGTAFNFYIPNPYADYSKTNRIDIEVDPGFNLNQIPSEFDIVCNVSVVVRENRNTVYANPTVFEVTIPMKFRNSALGNNPPGKKFVDQIIDREESVSGFLKYVGIADQIMSTLSDLCNVQNVLGQSQVAGVGLKVTGFTLDKIVPGLGVGPGKGGEAVYDAAEKPANYLDQKNKDLTSKVVGKSTNNLLPSGVSSIISQSCNWVTCNVAKAAEDDDNWYYSGKGTFGDFADDTFKSNSDDGIFEDFYKDVGRDVVANLSMPNPKNSIIAAVQTQCWSAVLSHVNRYRQSECQVLTCMKQNSKHGLDIGVCDEAKAQFICQSIVGEVFELPYMRESKNLMDNANAVIQSLIPKAAQTILNNVVCDSVIGPDVELTEDTNFLDGLAIFGCQLPNAITKLQYALSNRASNAAAYMYQPQVDACGIALCNERDLSKCQAQSSSWIQQYVNINLPGARLTVAPEKFVAKPQDIHNLITKAQSSVAEERDPALQALDNLGYDTNLIQSQSKEGAQYIRQITEASQPDSQRKYKPGYLVTNKGVPEWEYKGYDDAVIQLNTLDSKKKNIYRNPDAYDSPTLQTFFNGEHGNDGYTSLKQQYEQAKYNGKTSAANTLKSKLDNYESSFIPALSEAQKADLQKYKTADDNYWNEKEKFKTTYKSYSTALDDYLKTLNNDLKTVEADLKTETDLDKIKALETKKEDLNKEIKDANDRQRNSPEAFQADVKKIQRQRKAQEFQKEVGEWTDFGVALLHYFGWLNWASLTSFGQDTFLGQVSNFADTWLNSDKYKENFCSANFLRPGDSLASGAAIQCTGGLCQPVLTQAAEKFKINDTHWGYTYVYYLGNVKKTNNQSGNIKYNVWLKGSGGSHRLFNTTWLELQYYRSHDFAQAFAFRNDYNEVCIDFERDFPPSSQVSKTEYCRKIVDTTQGDTDFDTGVPVTDQYVESRRNPVQDTGGSDENQWTINLGG